MARIIDGSEKNLVGEQVRALRIKRGMSQQALSDRLETMAIYVCRGSVSRIEDRQRTVTDIELYGLSQVLGVPLAQIFGPFDKKKWGPRRHWGRRGPLSTLSYSTSAIRFFISAASISVWVKCSRANTAWLTRRPSPLMGLWPRFLA